MLDDIQFSLLDSLAEAAEKYEVSAARSVCHIRMRCVDFYIGYEIATILKATCSLALREHPAEILRYADKHDYPKLLSDVAPLTIGLPLLDVVSVLPPHLILTWVCHATSIQLSHTYVETDFSSINITRNGIKYIQQHSLALYHTMIPVLLVDDWERLPSHARTGLLIGQKSL